MPYEHWLHFILHFWVCANCPTRLCPPWWCVLILFVKGACPSTRYIVAIQNKLTKSQNLRVGGTLEAVYNNPNWSAKCLSIQPVLEASPMTRIYYFLKQVITSLNSSDWEHLLVSLTPALITFSSQLFSGLMHLLMFICAHLYTVDIFSAF